MIHNRQKHQQIRSYHYKLTKSTAASFPNSRTHKNRNTQHFVGNLGRTKLLLLEMSLRKRSGHARSGNAKFVSQFLADFKRYAKSRCTKTRRSSLGPSEQINGRNYTGQVENIRSEHRLGKDRLLTQRKMCPNF